MRRGRSSDCWPSQYGGDILVEWLRVRRGPAESGGECDRLRDEAQGRDALTWAIAGVSGEEPGFALRELVMEEEARRASRRSFADDGGGAS